MKCYHYILYLYFFTRNNIPFLTRNIIIRASIYKIYALDSTCPLRFKEIALLLLISCVFIYLSCNNNSSFISQFTVNNLIRICVLTVVEIKLLEKYFSRYNIILLSTSMLNEILSQYFILPLSFLSKNSAHVLWYLKLKHSSDSLELELLVYLKLKTDINDRQLFSSNLCRINKYKLQFERKWLRNSIYANIDIHIMSEKLFSDLEKVP